MMRSPISRPRRGEFSCHAVSRLELCSSPSPKSSTPRHFATQAVESNADASDVWFTHCLPEPYNLGPETDTHSAAGFYRRPYMDAPSGKYFRRAPFLPNFPCFPSVTRFGAGPAPCGTARLCFALADALRVSAFRKSFVQRTPKHFPNLPKKRRWALGAGHSRVASRKSVPRAIRANSIRRN